MQHDVSAFLLWCFNHIFHSFIIFKAVYLSWSCITRYNRWPCYTSRKAGLSGPHCCPQTQTAAPVICPDLKHTEILTLPCLQYLHHYGNTQIRGCTDRAVERSAGWRPWRAGWGGGASRAAGECGSKGCGPLWDSAGTYSGVADQAETPAGSWTRPESPDPADHRSLKVSDRHENESETVSRSDFYHFKNKLTTNLSIKEHITDLSRCFHIGIILDCYSFGWLNLLSFVIFD